MLSIYAIKNSGAAASYYEKDDGYYTKAGQPEHEEGQEQGAPGVERDDDAGQEGPGGSAGGAGGPGAATATAAASNEVHIGGEGQALGPTNETQQSQGEWYGKGAELLGLEGSIDPATFKRLLDGELPNGVMLGTMKDGKLNHRPGWDLTFSAPKTVSIVAEIGGDERVVDAFNESVKEALDYLQDNAAAYRQRGLLGVREREGDNLTFALFQHDTNRNQEANLHVHAVTANAIRREDGKWASLYETPLFEQKMAAGNVQRASLAMKLQKLGYEVERTHLDGRFEIVGVPEAVAEANSTRRAEIEQAMRDRGLEGAEAAAQAAVMTRTAKRDIPRDQLRPGWIAQSKALGFDAEAFVAAARETGPLQQVEDPRLDRAVREAIGRLAEAEAVFPKSDLIRWSLANAMGKNNLEGILPVIEAAARSQSLYDTHIEHRRAWTTPQARVQEKYVVSALERGTVAVDRAATGDAIESALQASAAEGRPLLAGQEAAVRLMATSQDRFIGIVGRPGTGKTTMLNVARQVYESGGYSVHGMAANSEAARQLQREAGIPSSTIHKHIRAVGEDLVKFNAGNDKVKAEIRQKYEKQVWVIDEASQVGSKIARRVMTSAEKLGARLVQVGDPRQLAAINAGKPFKLMLSHGMKHVEMKEIQRQHDLNQRQAVHDASDGNVRKAMERLAPHVIQIADQKDRLAAIVRDWASARNGPQRTMILTPNNADRTFLNDRMRDVKRDAGELPGEEPMRQLFRVFGSKADHIEAETYKPGDVVRFGKNAKRLGIKAGEYFRVDASDRRSNTLRITRIEAPAPKEGSKPPPLDQTPIVWNPRAIAGGAESGIEQFRPRETTIAPGEQIVWNRNSSGAVKLANGQPLIVAKIAGDKMTLRKDDGSTIEVDTSKHSESHWEHNDASTIFKSQGNTGGLTLANAPASAGDLFNQKAFLVAISRQRDNIRIYTDDTKKVTANIENRLGDKTSAIEANQGTRFRRAALFLEKLGVETFRGITRPSAQQEMDQIGAPAPGPQRDQGRDGPSMDPF